LRKHRVIGNVVPLEGGAKPEIPPGGGNINGSTCLTAAQPNLYVWEIIMPLDPSLSEAVSASFLELSSAAQALNAISDELGRAIADIDDNLKKMNLGITAWVAVKKFGGRNETDQSYKIEELGYAKINGKWGTALRSRSGDGGHPEYDEVVDTWIFNEAPRGLRLKAIRRLPELLKKLSDDANQLTKELQEKLGDAQAVAAAIQEATSGPKSPGRARPVIQPVIPMNTQASSLISPPGYSEVKK